MNGLQVAQALGAVHPGMRILVISGYPSAELEARVNALAFAQFLGKPFEVSVIVAAVQEASIR